MENRTAGASLWVIANVGVENGLRLLTNMVLSRLLFPEAFGLMAIVNVVIAGIGTFSDIGIGPSIIRHKSDSDREFLDTVWTIQAARGAMIYVLVALLAYPTAEIYGQPLLVPLLQVAGLKAVLQGFNSASIFVLRRNLELRALTLTAGGIQVITAVAVISWVALDPTLWALVYGNLLASALMLVASHTFLSTHRHRLYLDRAHAEELFRFGRWIFVSTGVGFLGSNVDRLLLGKLADMERLGVFSFAVSLASLSTTLTAKIARDIFFPVLTNALNRGGAEALRPAVYAGRRLILPAALLMSLGLALISVPFFTYLYKQDYADAGWMTQLLCVGVWIDVLRSTSNRALLASGNSAALATESVFLVVARTGALIVGYELFGMVGFALAPAVAALIGLLVTNVYMVRARIFTIRQDLGYSALGGVLAASAIGLPRLGAGLVSPLTQELLGYAISLLVLGALGIWAVRRLVVARGHGARSVPAGG